jgi:hypothetical protein
MTGRFASTIDLGNGADLEVIAGDVFWVADDRPKYIVKNNHYVKIGLVKNVEQLVVSANQLSASLMNRAIAFYRGYKFPESRQTWQNKERLNPSIAQIIWDYYKKS